MELVLVTEDVCDSNFSSRTESTSLEGLLEQFSGDPAASESLSCVEQTSSEERRLEMDVASLVENVELEMWQYKCASGDSCAVKLLTRAGSRNSTCANSFRSSLLAV
jgi:hypothetical protein